MPIDKQPKVRAPVREPLSTSSSTSAPRPSDDLTTEQLIKLYGNKSAAIRALHKQNYTISEIAKKMGVIYQHARNVVLRPLKRTNHNATKEE